MFNNIIKCAYYNNTIKIAGIIPEEFLNDTVNIFKEALPYIKCEIKSTIQHEGGHRKDEESRNLDILQNRKVLNFDSFVDKTRAEPIAEKEEDNCGSLYPHELSGETISVNLNQIFEEAKAASKINLNYKQDVKAGTLAPEAVGSYLMQDMPKDIAIQNTSSPNKYQGFDGTLWIDVRKIVQPFLSTSENKESNPPTYQVDGVFNDQPGVSRIPATETATTAVPSKSSVPAVPSIGAR